MSKRDRLGRGLGALLGEMPADAPVEAAGPARTIKISEITPNQYQPRREFAEEELADLVNSLRENGLLQPIVVRPAPQGAPAKWELVAGERRWRAATRLGWKELPAMVKEIDDRTMLVLALVENLQRSQLNALEEAEAYARLGEEFSLTQQEIAETVGKDRSTVANALRLLQLPASVRQLLNEGKLSAGHARALLALDNDRRIADVARAAVEHGWSVREIEAQVQRAAPKRRATRERTRDGNERALEEELQRVLGTPARIKRGRGMKGRIEIPFYNADDFERIYERIAGRAAVDVIS